MAFFCVALQGIAFGPADGIATGHQFHGVKAVYVRETWYSESFVINIGVRGSAC